MERIKINFITMNFENETLFEAKKIVLRENETYCFLGKNGTGKSTFFRLIAKLLKPTQGEINLFGDVLYQPQKPKLFKMTCLQNAFIGLSKEYEHKATLMFEALNISYLLNKSATILSGGEAQKVALIRSLLHKKDVILLDEPFSSCDEQSTLAMLALIKKHSENSTVIIATHSIKTAKMISQNALLLEDKRLIITDIEKAIEHYSKAVLEE